MLSFNRRNFVLILTALAGCGFKPAYGPGNGADSLRGQVLVRAPRDQYDFALVKRLEERLGRAEGRRYQLDYTLFLKEIGLAISPTQETTRFHIVGKAEFRLTDTASDKVAMSGVVDSFTSYSATGTTVSTQVAKEDAYRRLLVILADQIVTRLLALNAGGGQ